MVSRFIQKAKVSHLATTKRILRYLKGTLEYDFLFPAGDEGKECKLVGYTDLSWCSDYEDRKSTTGYVFMLGGTSVAQSSRKEPIIALSSCEAEYIVTSLCACQATWMTNLVEKITGKGHRAITTTIDNMSAINLAKNQITHERSKHIEMKFHYLREKVASGKLNLKHCRVDNQIAEIMTKGVQIEVFKRLRAMMNVDNFN